MVIGIDCRLWNQTGVGRYTRNLVKNLIELDKNNKYILFVQTKEKEEIFNLIFQNANFKLVVADIKWHSIEEQINLPGILQKERLDLMHFPYFSIPYFYSGKYIMTLHDLINNKINTGKASTLPYPLFILKKSAYKIVISNAIKKSIKIIVPSQSVKKDLLDLYPKLSEDEDKVEVTYEGGFEKNLKSVQKNKYGKYFLRVGNFYPHKNVETLLFSFSRLIKDKRYNLIKLVLVGKKDFFYNKIKKIISDFSLEKNIIFVENPKDSELYNLYANSIATIIPSLMEGFSLTAVEAMSLKNIVIASDISVHREICQDNALFFNPKDKESLKEKMEYVLNLPTSTRENLIKNGYQRSEVFSWKIMAEKTLGIYESCIGLR